MVGMIFCAGLGTRLKPLTDTMPKALVPLAGKPLLQWQVERLRDAGITDIIVNVHHFPDMIIDTVRRNNGWGCNISISDEREMLLDTGGGLKKAVKEGPILACNVDILSNLDLCALVSEYERTKMSQLVVSERETQGPTVWRTTSQGKLKAGVILACPTGSSWPWFAMISAQIFRSWMPA